MYILFTNINLFILEWVYKIKGYTMRKKYIGLLILIFSLFNATLLTISATSEDIQMKYIQSN